jgi:AAA15 family ATPase/GTPase
MISRLSLKNFSVFEEADLRFSQHLNVIIGENGMGKSHLLKLLYATASSSQTISLASRTGKEEFQRVIADGLRDIFKPDSLGRLVTRQQGRNRADIQVQFSKKACNYSFSFASNSKTEVRLEQIPTEYQTESAIFFPTREMLSIFPGFAATYLERELSFDRTYYDLAMALAAAPLRGRRLQENRLIEQLEKLINGSVVVQNGQFYLSVPGEGNFEMQLVAEGVRKIAMLMYLLVNGKLRQNSILFWDEPETNLNPRLLKNVAKALLELSNSGIQVFIATHSLFLLRELYLQEQHGAKIAFFNLWRDQTSLQIDFGSSLEDVQHVAALDADLEQSSEFYAIPISGS